MLTQHSKDSATLNISLTLGRNRCKNKARITNLLFEILVTLPQGSERKTLNK